MKRLKAAYTAGIVAAGIGFVLLTLNVIILTGPASDLLVEFSTATGWLWGGMVVAGVTRFLMWWGE